MIGLAISVVLWKDTGKMMLNGSAISVILLVYSVMDHRALTARLATQLVSTHFSIVVSVSQFVRVRLIEMNFSATIAILLALNAQIPLTRIALNAPIFAISMKMSV